MLKGLSRVKQLAIRPIILWDEGSHKNQGWLNYRHRKEDTALVGHNLETETNYHFLQVAESLDSLEVLVGSGVTTSGNRAGSNIAVDVLSSLSSSDSTMKHLHLIHAQHSNKMDLSVFKALKNLSLNDVLLTSMKEDNLGSSIPSVETIQLICYWAYDGSVCDEDFEEERLLSSIISTEVLPNLKEIALPAKPVDDSCMEAVSFCSIYLWQDARSLLKKNERVASGRVKLRTIKAGQTGESSVENLVLLIHTLHLFAASRLLFLHFPVGDETKGENCLSAEEWISPFSQ